MHFVRCTPLSIAFAAVLVALAPAIVSAQTVAPPPPEKPSPQKVPEAAQPGLSGSSSESLSDKLDRSGGVIRPPSGVDPELAQKPPPVGPKSMPVIPPPGTPGDESGVKPK